MRGMEPYPDRRRRALDAAQLLLVFTPELVTRGDALERLAEALPHVDLVQVRTKQPGSRQGPSPARPLLRWAERALDLAARLAPERPLVTVNDRVDVAATLAPEGIDGVHLGDLDQPADQARSILGPELLVGWSTHSVEEVTAARSLPVDYLGFGPVAPTRTKGLEQGLGVDAALRAAAAARQPVFAIGGVDVAIARGLGPGARVAVGAALLDADDVAEAAAELRRALGPREAR